MIVRVICLIVIIIGNMALVYIRARIDAKDEIKKEKTKAFYEGYKRGHTDGFYEGVSSKITPNLIREYLGLPPINKEADNEK